MTEKENNPQIEYYEHMPLCPQSRVKCACGQRNQIQALLTERDELAALAAKYREALKQKPCQCIADWTCNGCRVLALTPPAALDEQRKRIEAKAIRAYVDAHAIHCGNCSFELVPEGCSSIRENKTGLSPAEGEDLALCGYCMALEMKQREAGWRCFHCGEVFTDREQAAEHFGSDRDNPQATVCTPESMLEAIYSEFERYGVHRSFHNAASVKQLVNNLRNEAVKREAEIRREVARECAIIASEVSDSYSKDDGFPSYHAVGAETVAVTIRKRFALDVAAEPKEGSDV